MGQELIHIVSSDNDHLEWDNIAYKKSNQINFFAPESRVMSLHSGFMNMHFHYISRPNYILFINFYNILQNILTRGRSDGNTIEFTYHILNNILSLQAGFKEEEIKEGYFNITHYPTIDSKINFEANKLYITMDIHPTSAYLQHLTSTYQVMMEPVLNKMEHKIAHSIFPIRQPYTAFMNDFVQSIFKSVERGGINYSILDKDVESLMVHSLTYNPNIDLQKLNTERRRLLNEVLNTVLDDMTVFTELDKLARFLGTNKTTFDILFKEAFYVTATHLWKDFKLDEALYMLVHNREKKIKEISYMLGYKTLSHLTNAITKQFGFAPSVIRNDQDIQNLFSQVNF